MVNLIPASRTLQRLGGGGEIVVEIGILNHEITSDDGQREVKLDVRLSGRKDHFLRLVPHFRLVSQLDHGLQEEMVHL